jgi:hypothetical protein
MAWPAFLCAQSPIQVHIAPVGTSGVLVSWNTDPGATYVLQTSTDLIGPWQDVSSRTGAEMLATGAELSIQQMLTGQTRLYRVVLPAFRGC